MGFLHDEERRGACGGRSGEVMDGGRVLKSLIYGNQAGLRPSVGRRLRPVAALYFGRPAGTKSLSVRKLCGLKVENMVSLAREV